MDRGRGRGRGGGGVYFGNRDPELTLEQSLVKAIDDDALESVITLIIENLADTNAIELHVCISIYTMYDYLD